MTSKADLRDPYRPPASHAATIPEVPWLPLFTLSCGPLAFGIALLGLSSNGAQTGVVSTLLGLSLVAAGALQRVRRRRLAVVGADEAQLLRGGSEGPSFDRSALRRLAHPSWPTMVYGVLLLGFVRASANALREGHPLAPNASSGDVAERVTGGGLGFLVGALCAVAILRRITCTRVEVPGEKRALWVRDDDLGKLGLQVASEEK